MKNKVLLILGMHRSGTSLTANWMHLNGVSMGQEFVPAAESNRKGHYEDLDFFKLHKKILKENGQDGNGIKNLSTHFWSTNNELEIEQMMKKRLSTYDYVAFKEPRTVLFLPIYQNLDLNLFSISIYRPFEEVVDSLLRRESNKMIRKYYTTHGKNVFNQFIINQRIKKLAHQNINEYLKCWIYYNEMIINHVKMFSQSSLLMPLNQLSVKQDAINQQLAKWGFLTNNYRVEEVMEEKLMKTEKVVLRNCKDSLIRKANEISKQLDSLSFK